MLVIGICCLVGVGCSTSVDDLDLNVQPLRIAVAANVADTTRDLAIQFTEDTGYTTQISVGSTGALTSQITHGAPFDVFLSADEARPERLEQEGLIVPQSRATYALGSLALCWQNEAIAATGSDQLNWQQLLRELPNDARIAIANPTTAPYGLAAKQALENTGLWDVVKDRLVYGQSIGQTYQFVSSGAAQLAIVATSQVLNEQELQRFDLDFVNIPQQSHQPIVQQMVVLSEHPAAQVWRDWILNEPRAKQGLRASGYECVCTASVALQDVHGVQGIKNDL